MSDHTADLAQRLAVAEATIAALLSGQIDAVVDSKSQTPVLLFKAQTELRESEARYRNIVETANEGICCVDEHSALTFVNQRMASMLGYELSTMLGQLVFQFLPDVAGARTAHGLRLDRSRGGVSEEHDVRLVRRDGSDLWVSLRTSPIQDAHGTFVGMLAMMTDRTHARRAEESLRKSEAQYRQIVETTSDGIITVDEIGRVVFVNRRLTEMVGYEASEMPATGVVTAIQEVLKAGGMPQHSDDPGDSLDSTFRHKDGTEISVNIAVTPLTDGDGRHIGNMGVVRNVTERRKLLSQLMVSDRMASVGTMASGVAHEINNPLAAVVANLEYIAESVRHLPGGDRATNDPVGREAWFMNEIKGPLDDAREGAERVRFIVRDLRIFSRSPTDDPRQSVNVKAVMESSLRMGWNEIRHRARLVKLYGAVPDVDANEARLGQVFLNLLVNAAQALPEGRAEHHEIRVRTRAEADRVVIEVSDTGEGIAPENLGRIFDAFYTTKAVGVGTGLGLAICHRIVTDLGGALTVESEVGKGATFRVSLLATRDTQPEAPRVSVTTSAGARRGRILVIDDDVSVLRAVERLLSREHEVVSLTSATDGLARCAKGEAFDVIFCDLMMPDMSGAEFHRGLALISPARADGIIFLTGGAFTEKARHFLAEMPNERLEKPFIAQDLRAIVQRFLRRRPGD